jgi:DNA-binding GntR family transcriptional regulator
MSKFTTAPLETEASELLETGSASDAIFFGILNGLENQTIVPAQRLVEVDLAANFGVSRNSVREGLQRLAAEGVVELLRHKGAVIRSLSFQDTLDVLDVAELMTGLLARAAASATPKSEQVRAIEQVVRELKAADKAHDSAAFSLARRRFYRVLLELGGNRELRRLFPAIHMPIVYAQYRLPSLQQLRLRDYGRIAAAVLAKDADKAEALGREHVQNVRTSICEAPGVQLPSYADRRPS